MDLPFWFPIQSTQGAPSQDKHGKGALKKKPGVRLVAGHKGVTQTVHRRSNAAFSINT